MKGRASLPKSLKYLAWGSNNRDRMRSADTQERFAFTAIIKEDVAMVARVVAATGVFRPQQEYGYFESWTEAHAFAVLLNQLNGIGPVEARHIVVSATLASRCMDQK